MDASRRSQLLEPLTARPNRTRERTIRSWSLRQEYAEGEVAVGCASVRECPLERERSERPPVPKVSTVGRRFASKLTEFAEDLQRILCSPAIEREFFGCRPLCRDGVKIMRPRKAVSNLGRNGEETGFSAFRFPAFGDPFDEGVVGAHSDDLGEPGKANRGQPLRRDRW